MPHGEAAGRTQGLQVESSGLQGSLRADTGHGRLMPAAYGIELQLPGEGPEPDWAQTSVDEVEEQ